MILSLINQKGGVGKTTNTIHLGARLAFLGHKVLLIDLDPQCDLSHGTGVKNVSYDICDFFDGTGDFRLKQRAENFFILPGNENFLAQSHKRFSLKEKLTSIKDAFDYILIDCPPAAVNPKFVSAAEIALCACDQFLIPLEAKEYPVKNANAFLGRVFDNIMKHNKDLTFVGFFFSNILVTRRNIRQYSDLLKKNAEDYLFDTFVRADIKVENAIQKGQTIFQYEPNCRASQDYINLTDEFLKRSQNG